MALWGYPQSTLSSPRDKVFPLQPRSRSRCTPVFRQLQEDFPLLKISPAKELSSLWQLFPQQFRCTPAILKEKQDDRLVLFFCFLECRSAQKSLWQFSVLLHSNSCSKSFFM